MEMKDVYASLETLENGSALIDAIKSNMSRVNSESAERRKELETVTKELSEFKSEYQTGFKTLQEMLGQKGGTNDPGIDLVSKNSFQKQIETLREQMTTLQKEKEAKEREAFEQTRNNELRKNLSKLGLIDDFIEDFTGTLSNRYKMDGDGNWVKEDGTPMSEDLEKTLEGKDQFLKNKIQPGGDRKPPAERATPTFGSQDPMEKFRAINAKIKGGQ